MDLDIWGTLMDITSVQFYKLWYQEGEGAKCLISMKNGTNKDITIEEPSSSVYPWRVSIYRGNNIVSQSKTDKVKTNRILVQPRKQCQIILDLTDLTTKLPAGEYRVNISYQSYNIRHLCLIIHDLATLSI